MRPSPFCALAIAGRIGLHFASSVPDRLARVDNAASWELRAGFCELGAGSCDRRTSSERNNKESSPTQPTRISDPRGEFLQSRSSLNDHLPINWKPPHLRALRLRPLEPTRADWIRLDSAGSDCIRLHSAGFDWIRLDSLAYFICLSSK